jgi:hypothetical protein
MLHIFLKIKVASRRAFCATEKNLQPSKENIQHSEHKKPSVAQLCYFEPDVTEVREPRG